MKKRERQKSDGFVRQVFVPEAVLTRGLSGNAVRLYVYLLAHHASVNGPLGELAGDRYFRNVGMGKTAIERAGRELAEQGFYSYGHERRPDGTFARVQWVTEVPDTLDKPEPTRRPAPPAKTAATSGNVARKRAEQVRPAEKHPADRVSARQRQFSPQGAEQVRPAETVSAEDVFAGQRQFWPQGAEQVRPAETVSAEDVFAGQRQFWPQGAEQVRPAETDGLDRLYAGQDGFVPARASSFSATNQPTPPPSPQELPAPRRSEEEGISISTGEARAWLGRLPFRSRIRPGTSLGPVVARFLSAPGPWPREVLARELSADLQTANNVEAVLHSRLKGMNPVYDPADYPTAAAQPNLVARGGERVPVEALKPAPEDRTRANAEYAEAMARLRAGIAERNRRG